MNYNMKKIQKELLALREHGIIVEADMIDQIINGNIKNVRRFVDEPFGGIPLYTFTDYVGKFNEDLIPGESHDTLEEALQNGIIRGKELLDVEE